MVAQPARMQKHPLGPRGIAERGPRGAQARTPEGKNQLSPSRSPESLRPAPVSSPPSPQTLLPPQASSDALGSGAWPERGKDGTGGGLAEAGDIISLTQAENDLWPELCTKSKGGGGD